MFQFLEDLTVTYDGTVRDSRDDIVQFKYGSDGFDPCEMEVDSFPVDFDRELINVKVAPFFPLSKSFKQFFMFRFCFYRLTTLAEMKAP